MTYIEYLNGFNRWLESNVLPGNAQLMFFKFLDVFNRAGWPEYVQVDNLRLTLMIDAGAVSTAIRARDKLVEAGFLVYVKGKKGTPNKYGIKNSINFATISATISATDSATDSATISATHIKTKTKTKEKTPSESKRKVFVPPSVEEVRAYCQERKNGVDPQSFVDHYAARGWKYNGNVAMKDWKAAVRTWEKNRREGGRDDYWT